MKIPYTVKYMVRGGKRRRCVIQYALWPDGKVAGWGRIIAMSI